MRDYPWSQVLRLAATEGDVYLKRIALPYSAEPALAQALSGWFPGKVPEALAVDVERRWLLLADAGVPLRRRLKAEFAAAPLAAALRLMADIQRETVGRVEALVSLGLADWRLATLAGRYPAPVEGAPDLTPGERAGLRALAPRFGALCRTLAASGVPEALEHCDFHDNNVLVLGDRLVVADWGDAVVSHPFLSLASCVDSAGWNHGLGEAVAKLLIGSYLEGWSAFGQHDRLAAAARLARRIRPIQVALNFARVIAAGVGAEAFRDVVAERLRVFLDAERLTTDSNLG
jgi:aminoglycoside/choline kinase family phosphotransferase